MTYNEKKSLYESMMTEIAKHVKSAINNSVLNEAYQSNKVTKFFKLALEKSKESDNQKDYFVFCCYNSPERNGNAFGDFSCGHFEGNRFQINDDIFGIEREPFKDAVNLLSDLNDNDCSGDVKDYDSEIGYNPENAALLICGPEEAFRLYRKKMLGNIHKCKLIITKPELVDYMLCINNEGIKKIEASYKKKQLRYFDSVKNTAEQTRKDNLKDNLKDNIKKFEDVYGPNGKEIVMKLKEISKLIYDSYDEKDKKKDLLSNIYSELIRIVKTIKVYV